MAWSKFDLTGGVVVTRDETALANGELASASGCRLLPGDTTQLHRDLGRTALTSDPTGEIVMLRSLNFESGSYGLIAATDEGLETFDSLDPGSGWTTIWTQSGISEAAVVHRGNQYFVGTDEGNRLLADLTNDYPMGMDATYSRLVAALTTTNTDTGNDVLDDDVFVYFFTEYDSTYDTESSVIHAERWQAPSDGDWPTINLWDVIDGAYYGGGNARADKIRLYRHYYGNGLEAKKNADKVAGSSETAHVGGLIAELTIPTSSGHANATYDDDAEAIRPDWSIQYPLIVVGGQIGSPVYEFYRQPEAFTIGTLFQDSLVVNAPDTSDQVIRYSPPGYPEYQPTPYFMYFATQDSDEIVGLHEVNDRLVVLLKGSVHRVNWLPIEGMLDQGKGKAQDVLCSTEGCVGRNASCRFSSSQGEFVAWVSKRGLRMTNGGGWIDACPDWSTDTAGVAWDILDTVNEVGLENAVLFNNSSLYRLELHVDGVRWDFYYHESHLKNGRLKAMGPTTISEYGAAAATIVRDGCEDLYDQVYTCSRNDCYQEKQSYESDDMEVVTGRLAYGIPMNVVRLQSVGLTHDGVTGGTITVKVEARNREQSSSVTKTKALLNPELTESGFTIMPNPGHWVKITLSSSDASAHAWGPMWLDIDHESGGV